MAKLWQFRKVTQNLHFQKKCKDQEKFFKNRPKSRPPLKRPTALWRKCRYPRNCKARLKKSLAQKAATKRPEWPSYGNFRNVTQDPHFLKKCKGGTKRNFSKIAQKVALVWKAQKHSGANNIILYLVCTWSAKTAKDFGAKSGSKSARMAKLWQFSQGHPKAPFSEKCKGGTKKNFSKIVKKLALPSKTQQHSVANGIIL